MSRENGQMKKTALITGGSSGIGNSIARGLYELGVDVFIMSRRNPSEWEVEMPDSWDIEKYWMEVDLMDLKSLSLLLKKWLKIYGDQMNIFIHSAINYGSNKRRLISEIPLESWEGVFNVNTHAFFLITQQILPYLIKQSESLIVPISSEVAFNAGPGRMDYAASKAAAFNFTKSLIGETADSSINIVTLLPRQMVNTPGIRKRRKTNDDLSDYALPDSFITPINQVIETMGRAYHGDVLMVTDEGQLKKVDTNALLSNTRQNDRIVK